MKDNYGGKGRKANEARVDLSLQEKKMLQN